MIVTVTSMMPAQTGGFVWFAFEVPACASIDAIHAELKASGVIRGERIDTSVIDGARRVVRRTPCVIGVGIIGTITPLHAEIIDETGEVLG